MDSSVGDLRRRLSAAGIEIVHIGAHAANLYRVEVRHSVDVGFLVGSLEGVAEILESEGFSLRVVADDGVPYMIAARRGAVAVDLLLAETDYQRLAIERAANGVLTAEDVIIHKLIAGRSRDLDDIASIIAAGIALDQAYIATHAEAWGVLDRWRAERVTRRSGPNRIRSRTR